MLIYNAILFGLVLLVNLTSSTTILLSRLDDSNILPLSLKRSYQNLQRAALKKPSIPVYSLLKKPSQKHDKDVDYDYISFRTSKKQSRHPDCSSGTICIKKLRHQEDSIVINNGNDRNEVREYATSLDNEDYHDNHAGDDDYEDDYPFSDLTRLQTVENLDNIAPEALVIENKLGNRKFITDYDKDLLRAARIRAIINNREIKKNNEKGLRKFADFKYRSKMQHPTTKYVTDSDTDTSSSDDERIVKQKYIRKKKRYSDDDEYVPTRFTVVKNSLKNKYYDDKSASGEKYRSSQESESIEITTSPPKFFMKKKTKQRKLLEPYKSEAKKKRIKDNFGPNDDITEKKEIYMQGLNRFYKVGPKNSDETDGDDNDDSRRWYDFRKRLQHFLPKRYHWDEKDYARLGYYWFHGPQGKYPGIYKIAY